jgi:hypothetical protein
VAALHKQRYSPVAALHKRHYLSPHAPVTSDSNGVLHLVSEPAIPPKKKSHKKIPIRSGHVDAMEAATTTTAEKLSAINESLVQLNMALGRIAAR